MNIKKISPGNLSTYSPFQRSHKYPCSPADPFLPGSRLVPHIEHMIKILCLSIMFRLKKEKTTAEMESGVPHVLFQEPLYPMQDQVFYPAATPGYDITAVTSSHPQSSTLGAYDNMSMYSVGMPTVMSNYDLLGPSVPPPTSELKETHSAMDAEIYGWSDED